MASQIIIESSLEKSPNAAAEQWLRQLGVYATKHSRGDAASKDSPLKSTEHREPQQAVWSGRPFLLTGDAQSVKRFFDRIDDATRAILRNCGYYWILTDQPDTVYDALRDYFDSTRPVVLNWAHHNWGEVWRSIEDLTAFPNLSGLSNDLRHIRAEIRRIAAQTTGPWSPVLIFGESGTGKEEVARALHQAARPRGSFAPVACGWLTETLLQDQLFGHVKGAFSGANRETWGLLHNSAGTTFLDDFDAAPTGVQGALLRILATKNGEPAFIRRLGEQDLEENAGQKQHRSNAWLVFSTNADIPRRIREGTFREDLLFRFEDRVLVIPPLAERPADIPSIGRTLWEQLWDGVPTGRARHDAPWRLLVERSLGWSGNVRALRTLLTLASSMAKLSAHNQDATSVLFEEILARGPEYLDWVRILTHPAYTKPLDTTDPLVKAIRAKDANTPVNGTAQVRNNALEPPWPTVPSEKEAQKTLAAVGRTEFEKLLLSGYGSTRSKNVVRTSVRLSRIVLYVNAAKRIDLKTAELLNDVVNATARKDVERLVAQGILKTATHQPGAGRATLYEPAPMF